MLRMFFEYVVMAEAIIVVVISGLFGLFAHKQKKNECAARKRAEDNEAKVERRAELRKKESLLAIRLMSASVNLTIATALAVQRKKTNGFMTAALSEARSVQDEYKRFREESHAEALADGR